MNSRSSRETLLAIIRRVRNRWRLKVALQGMGVVLAGALLLFLFSGWGMDRLRFGTGAVLTFRLLTYAAIAGLGWRFLVRPLARRVSDDQVALYLEEHEPSLEGTVVSAVDAGAESSGVISPALGSGGLPCRTLATGARRTRKWEL